ncbi:MAG: hypothetical protein AAGE84_25640 [Cyanobacteria bacterium P01_G01_bin.39]
MLEPVKTIKLFHKPPSPRTFRAGEVIYGIGIISGEVDILVDGRVLETIKNISCLQWK